jgi:putative endonuclease
MYKGGAVYIMSSPNKGTLYVGVTSNLPNRIYAHKNKIRPASFASRYNCVIIVYYKFFESMDEAIAEEKRLKGASRKYKEQLIDSMNPQWQDLYEQTLDYTRS